MARVELCRQASAATSLRHVAVREVGLREGVQAFGTALPTSFKCDWILLAYAAGLRQMEVGTYAAPERAPQMADSPEVVAFAATLPGFNVSVFAHDAAGAQRAMADGATTVIVPLAASEKYCVASMSRSVEAMLAELKRICALRKEFGPDLQIEAGISTAFGCALEGAIEHSRVLELIAAAIDAGVDAITLADTFGRARPYEVSALCRRVRAAAPSVLLTAHLHGRSTQGNVVAAVAAGVDRLDASLAGIGGNPFVKGADGNVSVEGVASLLQDLDIESGVDMKRLAELRVFANAHPDARQMFDAMRTTGHLHCS